MLLRTVAVVPAIVCALMPWPVFGAGQDRADTGLVAYWPMDEQSGEVVRDATGRGHDLAVRGVEWPRGAVGRCLRLAGAKSSASTPLTDDLLPKKVTVAAWVRVDRVPRKFEGIGIVNAQTSYLLRISSGNGLAPSFHIFTDHWEPVRCPQAMRPGQWYHLVGTYDGQRMCIYVNGELAAARRRTGAINKAEGNLVIGRQVDALDGCVDEVRIYARALSADEVRALFERDRRRLNAGVEPGRLVEPFEELFGRTRHNPAPAASVEHLPAADLTFVVITDTHIGAPGEEGRYCHNWRVEEAIRQINELRPAFVVHCGDIITTFPFRREQFEAQCRNAVAMLKKFRCPVHLVPGNHDIGNQRNMRVWSDKWLARVRVTLEDMLFQDEYRRLYIKYFGRDFYSFQAGGCYFIVFDNQICNSGGALERQQMRWFEDELKKAGGSRAVFVFMHNPLFWADPNEPGPKNYEPVLQPARRRLLRLLERYRPAVVYSGHTHFAFESEYVGVHLHTLNSTTFNRNYAGVQQYMPGAAQIYDPYKLGYLVVRVRGRQVHESWVPLYWRLGDVPEKIGQPGRRLVARPASDLDDSVLGVRAAPPTTHPESPDGRMTDNDHWWRVGENIGAKWLQVWPMPEDDASWQRLVRGLTLDHPRGVKVAVPVPAEAREMAAAWEKLQGCASEVAALVVCNGGPENAKAPLSTWKARGTAQQWAAACDRARKLVPGAKVVLARLSLLGHTAAEELEQAAGALRGHADAIAVWMTTQGPLESDVLPALERAAEIVRARGMELWLDTASWQTVSEPTRSANFLRLLAECHRLGVRVFWWIGPDPRAGLIDNHLDPTPMYFAAQAWTAFVALPKGEVAVTEQGAAKVMRWRGVDGREYVAWWRPDDRVGEIGRVRLALGERAFIIDPLHARVLKLAAGDPAPLCSWPLVARLGASR